MQLTHGEWNSKWKEIASTAGRHEGVGATLKGTKKTWAGLGNLILLFLASLPHVVFGGTIGAPLKAAMKAWAALGILMLLFLASLAYGAFGGTFAFEASPIPESETSIASVPATTGDVGGAPINEKASSGSVQTTEYFPAAYPNRGRDGDGNVMTYEHD